MTTPMLDHVPQELKDSAQWVCFKFTSEPDPVTRKQNKCPINPRTGHNAKSNDPQTWTTFDVALAAIQRYKLDGVGFVFTGADPFVGVDLDGCLDHTGAVAPWALAIISSLNTYTEISPSGRGVKMWTRGTISSNAKLKHGGIELYSRTQMFCVTGQHLPGTPTTINEAQAALTALHVQLKPAPKARPSSTYTPSAINANDPYLATWVQRKCDQALDDVR